MNDNTKTIKYDFEYPSSFGMRLKDSKHILILTERSNDLNHNRQFQLGLQSDGTVVWLELGDEEKI